MVSPNGTESITKNTNGDKLGFENNLYQTTDEQPVHMARIEYKCVAHGRIFPKTISDALQPKYDDLAVRANTAHIRSLLGKHRRAGTGWANPWLSDLRCQSTRRP